MPDHNPPRVATNGLEFHVQGKPPLKGEAISVFNAKHGQAERIRALLQAAQRACQDQAFLPIEDSHIALDVITRSPAGDAANIIGGIADVLENKPIRAHRSSIDHLGDLTNVWLYGDDKQIKQISYREEEGDSSYTVAVRRL